MGSAIAEDVLRHAIALGADEGVLLEPFNVPEFDSFATAYILGMAVKKLGSYDLILCGREAADWNNGQVGSGIAEFLNIPVVTLVKNIGFIDTKFKVERIIPSGFEVIEVEPPVLLTVTNELGQPRYPNLKGIIAAKKKQIRPLTNRDIGLDNGQIDDLDCLNMVDLFVPVHERKCHIFKADSVAEAAAALARKIPELNPN
jgi:electron transfer flavoprotein beta subunit